MRFTYRRSVVYGWCVYDKEQGNIPAYNACSELLATLKADNSGITCPSPVLLQSEYATMSLCRRLNLAAKKA